MGHRLKLARPVRRCVERKPETSDPTVTWRLLAFMLSG
jgi:hypothetical protein